MKNAKHTPGPWIVRFENSTNILDQTLEIVSAEPTKLGDHAHVATVSVTTLRADPRNDANLISAAPDLLEVLELILKDFDGDWSHYERAKKAIAKARGES